jgi:iron complex outermembrane receptor protein
MFKRTQLAGGVAAVCGGVLLSAITPAKAQPVQRVEVTGSAIKRIDAETAVPVTIIKLDELKKEGVTTVEQILGRVAANQSSFGSSQSIGTGSGGAAFADLRGIGANKTLILLNGRRVANNAFDSSATDINMIPFDALERVEVLRDGASALYGTDAIGGVINFITRQSANGGQISAGADAPTRSGGKASNASLSYGFGDLDAQGYNVLSVLGFQKQHSLTAQQRAFGSTGVIPERGVGATSGTTYPANYTQSGVAGSSNPSLPGCALPYSVSLDSANSCRYDYTRWADLMPGGERLSLFSKASFKLSEAHSASLEYFASSNTNHTRIAPVPQTGLQMPTTSKFFPGAGITPLPTNTAAFAFDRTRPINVSWRTDEAGPREGETDNVQQRLIAQIEGVLAGWDYQAGAFFNQNKLTDQLTGGFSNDSRIAAGVRDGILNPFGPQDAAGAQFLRDAALRGTLQTGKGTVHGIDLRSSRDLADWLQAGRAASIALGAEFRKEKFDNVVNVPVAEQANSTGLDASGTVSGSRKVGAVFAELNLPVTPALELTAALRHDRYSDFGSTTNPKASFRWQPDRSVLVRGSYSTGFRAPSVYELYAPRTLTFTAGRYNDPLLCPEGTPAPGGDENRDCGQQFLIQRGGNLQLKPEKGRNLTLGVVFEPLPELSLGIDFWRLRIQSQITVLPEGLIFADPAKQRRATSASPAVHSLPTPTRPASWWRPTRTWATCAPRASTCRPATACAPPAPASRPASMPPMSTVMTTSAKSAAPTCRTAVCSSMAAPSSAGSRPST